MFSRKKWWNVYSKMGILVRLLKMVPQRCQVQCWSRFNLSFINSAFKYWLDSGIKRHLKRKGWGLSACMAPGRYGEPVWKWCILNPSSAVLFMDNIESLGQWAAGKAFFIISRQIVFFKLPNKDSTYNMFLSLNFDLYLNHMNLTSLICNWMMLSCLSRGVIKSLACYFPCHIPPVLLHPISTFYLVLHDVRNVFTRFCRIYFRINVKIIHDWLHSI